MLFKSNNENLTTLNLRGVRYSFSKGDVHDVTIVKTRDIDIAKSLGLIEISPSMLEIEKANKEAQKAEALAKKEKKEADEAKRKVKEAEALAKKEELEAKVAERKAKEAKNKVNGKGK